MNLVIFASDNKGLSSLNSTINEASNRNINIFVMISQDTQLRYPLHHPDRFQILTNCESTSPYVSKTLGVKLPFKPDWLIVNRERWNPESDIIMEFKKQFKCKVALIEPNSQMLTNPENILEGLSRNKFQDMIDVNFDHSTWIKKIRQSVGIKGNFQVVGNPKYDLNTKIDSKTIDILKKFYKISPNKKKVLLFSILSSSRSNLKLEYNKFITKNPDYQFFYKPYPGEPFDPKFKNDFYPHFYLPNCTPILEESHIWGMFQICDIHVGILGSINHATLLYNKEYLDFSKQLGVREKYLDPSPIFNQGCGIEQNKNMWKNVLNLKSDNELKKLITGAVMNQGKANNNVVWSTLDSYIKDKSNINKNSLLKLFDDFNDNQACKRIINYLENNI
tara:strand:- start:1323 stop:2495 length:1173 start_codon:yes stop_codon:yes gene_type:complete